MILTIGARSANISLAENSAEAIVDHPVGVVDSLEKFSMR